MTRKERDSPAQWDTVALRKKQWLLENRGICSVIAKELGVSATFVGQVLYGRRVSEGMRIEMRLRKEGAPL